MKILVSEVGPRDGLQSIKRATPTQAKGRWIRALAGAGLREIEVASFAPGASGNIVTEDLVFLAARGAGS